MRGESTRRASRAAVAGRVVWVALAGLCGSGVWGAGLAQSGVLFAVPTELQSAQALPADAPWHLALQAADLSELSRALNVSRPAPGANVLDYTLAGYPEIPGSPARTWLEDSFVIDYREHEVADLYAAFAKARAGQPWTRQALIDFVAAQMTASAGHPFEVASQVARTRDGDCKEYAVLTAALARSAGIPARVALGLAILERDGRYATFGHAWAEIREAGHWVVADPALRESRVRYLPFGILNDEGPGFQVAVMRLTPAWVQRVTIVGAATP